MVLNKASHARPAQMMRMLGALMWGLGRLCQFPERVRVFIGSFSGEPGKVGTVEGSALQAMVVSPAAFECALCSAL